MSACIGIDLGTSNTVVAACISGKPTIISNAEGERFTPSVATIDATTGAVHVGAVAKRQAVLRPRETIFSVKRLMGAYFDEVWGDRRHIPYSIIKKSEEIKIRIGGRRYEPAAIAGMILETVKQDAAACLGEEVSQAVITVPAYFNDRQRRATITAAKLAGLAVLRIINEPTAAAIAYGFSRPTLEGTIAVFHMGGGTLDVAIIDREQGVYEVTSVAGNTRLGGDDFDNCIVQWAADKLQRLYGIDPFVDPALLGMLRCEAEKAKCDLSTRETTDLVLPYLRSKNSTAYRTVSLSLSRSKFEERARTLIDRIAEPCELALKDRQGKLVPVAHVLLVGQQTRMPAIREAVRELFGKEPRLDLDPGEVVALGAALQAGVLQGQVTNMLLLDAIPISVGVETLNGEFTALIERNTTIPTTRKEIFSTAADNQTEVTLRVFQGEQKMATENLFVGEFKLTKIPRAPRGVPQIEVTFDVDANGVLLVAAKDLGSGRQQAISIGEFRTMRAPVDGVKVTSTKTAPRANVNEQDDAQEAPSQGQSKERWLKRFTNFLSRRTKDAV